MALKIKAIGKIEGDDDALMTNLKFTNASQAKVISQLKEEQRISIQRFNEGEGFRGH